ncbi:hypothetical protein CU097_008405 [Rhizopus azygosporus]|uniref:Uncharacterized protein n=1 Tax=Rhizopus azygosporus TaxID=86630 RepID=A0A367JIA4_RHIAZ|nr:hypothetical protein CU097_008405 [Rhizopus azygosporus]
MINLGAADRLTNQYVIFEEYDCSVHLGQLRKDKDYTRAVSGIAVNENENILPLQTETSQGASEKQASTSSAFNGNEDYIDSLLKMKKPKLNHKLL